MRCRALGPTVVAVLLMLGFEPCSAESRMEEATAQAAGKMSGLSPGQGSSESDEEVVAMPARASEAVLKDAETRQRYLAAMQRYYEYKANGYTYRSRVFEWQLMSSRLIFIAVLTLVSAGLYFAAVQFRIAMRAATRKLDETQASVRDTDLSLATQVEVSSKGVVVNSSVLGVIILALSLAFFYLYLVHVYPIKNVF